MRRVQESCAERRHCAGGRQAFRPRVRRTPTSSFWNWQNSSSVKPIFANSNHQAAVRISARTAAEIKDAGLISAQLQSFEPLPPITQTSCPENCKRTEGHPAKRRPAHVGYHRHADDRRDLFGGTKKLA